MPQPVLTITLDRQNMWGFLHYSDTRCRCSRFEGTCLKCRLRPLWESIPGNLPQEALEQGWVQDMKVHGYVLTLDGKRILERLELETI